MTSIPTYNEICEDRYEGYDFKIVDDTVRNDWRHGCTVVQVMKRLTDNTFWQLVYRVSTDGEWDGLREAANGDTSDISIKQVFPVEKTIIEYQ